MNRFVTYFVYVVALANILYFFKENNFLCIGVFALVAILTSFFSKNKVIILGVAIVVANVVCAGDRWKEGFKTKRNRKVDKKTMDLINKVDDIYDKLINNVEPDRNLLKPETDDSS